MIRTRTGPIGAKSQARAARIGTFLASLLVGTLPVGCSPSQPVPILYWNFDESGSPYAEKSGKLSAAVGTGTRSVPGASGHAVSFPEGQHAYMDLGMFNLPEYRGTLGMWIKPAPLASQTHYHVLIKGFNGHGPQGWALAFGLRRGGVLDLASGLAGDSYARSQSGAVQFGKWQHVCISWQPQGVTFYVDGNRVPTIEGRGVVRAVQHEDMPVALAKWGAMYYPEASYHGEIDELKIYDRVLTPTQVAAASKPRPKQHLTETFQHYSW